MITDMTNPKRNYIIWILYHITMKTIRFYDFMPLQQVSVSRFYQFLSDALEHLTVIQQTKETESPAFLLHRYLFCS